jgi:hypothetical protein
MNKFKLIAATAIITSTQGCSFTNRNYEAITEHNDYINTVSNLKVNEEYNIYPGELAFESTHIEKLNNIINCPSEIQYRDGIAKFAIQPGKYRILGSIEVQPGIKLPFILGGYQGSAVGGASGLSLYYPINKDGSIYPSYYTDAFFDLKNGNRTGQLKEWGGHATASDTCDYIAPLPSNINNCSVYYAGAVRTNGFLAPNLTIKDFNQETTRPISAGRSYTFCGTTIRVNQATNILSFTAIRISKNQPD